MALIVNLIGIGMVAMIAGTVMAILRYRDIDFGKKTADRFFGGISCALIICVLLNYYFSTVAVPYGGYGGSWSPEWDIAELQYPYIPYRQIIISSLCALGLTTAVSNPRIVWTSLFLYLFFGWITGKAVQDIISYERHNHTDIAYIQDPGLANVVTMMRQRDLRLEFEVFEEDVSIDKTETNQTYPPGWLKESKIWKLFPGASQKEIPNYLHQRPPVIVKGVPEWHTYLFTGLYRVDYPPCDIWFPGGKMKDGFEKLEYRERLK